MTSGLDWFGQVELANVGWSGNRLDFNPLAGLGVHAPRPRDRDQPRHEQTHGSWRLHLQASGQPIRLQDYYYFAQANVLSP